MPNPRARSDRSPAPEAGFVSIGSAAAALGVHPRTLMAYERMGLVKPVRKSNQRRYSPEDLVWLGCAKELNHDGGISLQGLATMLRFVPCWAIRGEVRGAASSTCCPPEYPAGRCHDRVEKAYSGTAAGRCRECGVYLSNREKCESVSSRR